jgi:hypothetical protein
MTSETDTTSDDKDGNDLAADGARTVRFSAAFDIRYDDYLALCDAQDLWKDSSWRLPKWAHWLLTAIIAVGGLVLLGSGDPWFGGVLLAGVAFLVLLEFVLIPLARWRSYKMQGLDGMRVTLKADDEGFNMANPKADSRIAWEAVSRIDRFRDCLILWTSRKTGLVLPERAFDHPGDAARFHDFVKEKSAGESA